MIKYSVSLITGEQIKSGVARASSSQIDFPSFFKRSCKFLIIVNAYLFIESLV